MSSKHTPLDGFIVNLAALTFTNPSSPNLLVSLTQHHLSMLRVIYLGMVEIDFYEKAFSGSPGTRTLSIEESALDMPLDSYRSILSYIQFLYVLSQFGRVLIKHGFINDLFEFPCYYRVKFYRNCVGEHWEEYVDFAGRRGLTFTKGKAAIPVVEELSHLGEKAAIEAELV